MNHMSWCLKLYKFFMLKIKGTKIGMSLNESQRCVDAGSGPHCDEDDTDEFLENISYSLISTDVGRDDLRWGQDDVEGMTIDASIIGPKAPRAVHHWTTWMSVSRAVHGLVRVGFVPNSEPTRSLRVFHA